MKNGFLPLLFFPVFNLGSLYSISAQPAVDSPRWLVPMSEKVRVFGKPTALAAACFDGEKTVLAFANGSMEPLKYDTAVASAGGWLVGKKGLFGFYVPEKGELVPPIYEQLTVVASRFGGPWAFSVTNYAQRALIVAGNRFVVPFGQFDGRAEVRADSVLQVGNNFYGRDGRKIERALEESDFVRPGFIRSLPYSESWGLRLDGELRLETVSNGPTDLGFGMRSANVGGSVGFFDKNCGWVVPPNLRSIGRFNGLGVAVALTVDNMTGLLCTDGTWLLKPTTRDQLLPTDDPALFVRKSEQQSSLADTLGRSIFPYRPKQEFIVGRDCEAIAVKSNDTVGIFLKNGRRVPLDGAVGFEPAGSHFLVKFPYSGAKYYQRYTTGVGRTDGTWLIPPLFHGLSAVADGFLLLQNQRLPGRLAPGYEGFLEEDEQQYFVYGPDGQAVLNEPIKAYWRTDDGLWFFWSGEKTGVVHRGKLLLLTGNIFIKSMGNGWFFAQEGGRAGLFRLD